MDLTSVVPNYAFNTGRFEKRSHFGTFHLRIDCILVYVVQEFIAFGYIHILYENW